MSASQRSTVEHWFAALNQFKSPVWEDLDPLRREVNADHPLRWTVDFVEAHETVEARRQANTMMVYCASYVRYEAVHFRRLLAEVARRRTRDDPQAAAVALQQVAELIDHADDRHLLALVRGYQADTLRVSGQRGQARAQLDQLLRDIGYHDGLWEREIRATLLELQIDHAHQHLQHDAVEPLLAKVEELTRGLPFPGRSAQRLWREGRFLLAVDRHEEAREVLTRAASGLQPNLDFHLRLDILHLQAFAEVECGRFDAAQGLIGEIDPLLPDWGSPLLTAQQRFLRGHLARRDEQHEAAAEHWQQALTLFASLGHFSDAQQALDHLLRLWRDRMA